MTAGSIMFMGTGSDVGKSLIVAGLCRLLSRRGLRVAPFKPQNMSNNAAAVDGGEIGRAQALQAQAAGVVPTVHMNPVLLKPESERGAQVIVQGQRAATLTARDYVKNRMRYMPAILNSFNYLMNEYELILVEGAGSPAEINLRSGDLANMGFAQAARVPVVLIGDIHRGGVIASVVGTKTVLDPDDQKVIKAFLINKLHGDPSLFDEGRSVIERQTGWPCLGVVPHFNHAHRLPAEDALALEGQVRRGEGAVKIAVLRLPRIANFDDLDPLRLEDDVTLRFVLAGEALPGDCDLVIIPGSKSTIADLAALRAHGWDIDIAAHVRRGGRVLGLCGGYQMLGKRILDPQGLEGKAGGVEGLNLLDVETTLSAEKRVRPMVARHVVSGQAVSGYEIHLGRTAGADCARPFAETTEGPEGATSPCGRITGTYLHGCFAGDGFRRAFLAGLGARGSNLHFEQVIEQTLDALADHLRAHVDVTALLKIAGVE